MGTVSLHFLIIDGGYGAQDMGNTIALLGARIYLATLTRDRCLTRTIGLFKGLD